ncbi:hypothetical protein DPMN_067854 [Dreissena polymorpha]|uniref:Uncharacterized protein n=2 Tax=Dreissena polymorpha TaxID=45954 RepID=A0A9D3Z1F9_DREPO|nr:hypothetical protein DPMN_067854 [Dreissena polymorpha]
MENILKSKHNPREYGSRCQAVSVLFQHMLIKGYCEAKASGQKDIFLKCRDYTFHSDLNETESNTLLDILMLNKSDVRTLIVERNRLHISKVFEVIQQSMHCLKRVMTRLTPKINTILHNLRIRELYFIEKIDVSSFSIVLPTLRKLRYLYIEHSTFMDEIVLPSTVQHICLFKCAFTALFFRRFMIDLSSLKHKVWCEFIGVDVMDYNTHLLQTEFMSSVEVLGTGSNVRIPELRSELLLCDMAKITIVVKTCSVDLFEQFRDTSIGVLHLRTAECASFASRIIPTLNKLTKLQLWGTYTGRFDLKLPDSLQFIILEEGECSSEWLCGMLITLSSIDHHVTCALGDVELQSSTKARGTDSAIHGPDMRSEILSCDMSKMTIFVKTGSVELFEHFRDTSIGILSLRTAECASFASRIIPTLSKLTEIHLWGTYTGRFNLKLPDSLRFIFLEEVECSSEWLCGMLITLSSIDHPVTYKLWGVKLQSNTKARGTDSAIHGPEMRSEILSCDLSKMTIIVKTGSVELFEHFRDTSIGILSLRTAECASFASRIIPTLNKLTEIHLWGTYTGRFNLKLPDSLRFIFLEEVECSSEWLCGMLITLSSIDHSVTCALRDVELQSSVEALGTGSNICIPELRSELLLCDMAKITLYVKTGSVDLFEQFRDSSIGILQLRTAECASFASFIIHTLNKLTKLQLCGTYTGRFNLKLPDSLRLIILEEVECSSEWLCGMLITLSSIDHPVTCALCDVELQSSTKARGTDSAIHGPDMRSEILSCDMSKMTIIVKTGSVELFEHFRDTSIGILKLNTAESASFASTILPTLKKSQVFIYGGHIREDLI